MPACRRHAPPGPALPALPPGSNRGRSETAGGRALVARFRRVRVDVNRYRVWLDRALSLVTVIVVVAAAYFVAVERVIPALRGEPATADGSMEASGSGC